MPEPRSPGAPEPSPPRLRLGAVVAFLAGAFRCTAFPASQLVLEAFGFGYNELHVRAYDVPKARA